MLPAPFDPSGHRFLNACFVCAELHVKAWETYVTLAWVSQKSSYFRKNTSL